MLPATVQSPGFKWYSSLYCKGHCCDSDISVYWWGRWDDTEGLQKLWWWTNSVQTDRHLFVALPALRFSHCQKNPKFYWSSNFSTAFKDHPYFIACSLLLLPLVCFSRELILWVHHNAQCKFPTMNARHLSKCWQQLSSLLPDMCSVPAGLSVLKSINPKWLVF